MDGNVFDSALSGAVEMDELSDGGRKWYRSFGRALLGIALFLPRLLLAVISLPFKRLRGY
ncbi:MAG: hypothetical protein U9N44_02075 [Chloroflexota bacterium]|nr:hypothetical protein [Chloroflexota bacterium]